MYLKGGAEKGGGNESLHHRDWATDNYRQHAGGHLGMCRSGKKDWRGGNWGGPNLYRTKSFIGGGKPKKANPSRKTAT